MTQIALADGKIWLALKARLEQFTGCRVLMPMQNTPPPAATDTFAVVQQVSLDNGSQVPLSPACGVMYSGFMSIGVCVPTDYDFAQALGMAGMVADHFPDGGKYYYQDVTVTIAGRPRVSGSVSLQAPWNRIDVRVPWNAWG